MSARRVFWGGLALVVLIGIAWILWLRQGEKGRPVGVARTPPPASAQSAIGNRQSAISAAAAVSDLAVQLNAPGGDIRADLRIVQELVDTFRTNFPREGNPVGDNADITAALAGRNRLELVLIAPNHRAINRAGELCDRWGTPFFFHALSGTRMELRSAGPDRKMWTDDDAVLTP
jgi:hypothetical protein